MLVLDSFSKIIQMERQTWNRNKKTNPIIQIGVFALFLLFSWKIWFGIWIVLIIIDFFLINKKLDRAWYKIKDLSWENSINILKYLFNENDNQEAWDDEDTMTQTNNHIETNEYNAIISWKFIKKMSIVTGSLWLTILLIILMFFWPYEFFKTNTIFSINNNDLFSWNSTLIRIILAILVAFIIFKVVKAIIDSKKYNKDTFKS